MELCTICNRVTKLLRKQRICPLCFAKRERPYEVWGKSVYGNSCGGVTVYAVQPRTSAHLRLHCVWHWEFGRQQARPQRITTWSQIWDACRGWCDESWKYKGPLRRGIMTTNGNGIKACVEWRS